MKIFVHGIGESGEEEVRKQAEDLFGKDAHVVYWSDIFDEDQKLLIQKYDRRSWADKWLIKYFGDVIAYHDEKRQKAINRVLNAIKSADKYEKIVIVAHSWGSVISYEALLSLSSDINQKIIFITLGSPLPLYAVKDRLETFRIPPILTAWYNITYKNDIVGFPLENLNPAIKDYLLDPLPPLDQSLHYLVRLLKSLLKPQGSASVRSSVSTETVDEVIEKVLSETEKEAFESIEALREAVEKVLGESKEVKLRGPITPSKTMSIVSEAISLMFRIMSHSDYFRDQRVKDIIKNRIEE